MNQKTISDLVLTEMKQLPPDMTESSHLSNAYLTEPTKMEGVLAYAMGSKNKNVLAMLTGGIGQTREVTNREYTWDLHGQNERAIEVAEPVTVAAQPGIGGTNITVKFSEDLFRISDNIVSDDGTQARVNEVVNTGAEWLVSFVLTHPDRTKWLDPSQIAAGARFSKDYSTVEEFSTKGGGTQYQAPMKLTNQLTTLRKTYTISRSAATDVMVIELYSPDGKNKTRMWTKLAEWTALEEWARELDRAGIYSVYNKNSRGETDLRGENGRPVFHGAGIHQQISPANKRGYVKLTFKLLDEFLLDLSYNATQWGGNTNFTGLTGKMGMREFDNCIQERKNSLGITVTDSGTFIKGNGENLELTGYFTTVKFMNGLSLQVKEFEPYDDIVRNRKLHPVSGRPLESYKITILNFGTLAGKSNIRKVVKKDSENAMWHVCGSTSPFDGVAKSINTMRSSGIDGYEVHLLSEFGYQIQDPTSCGQLYMTA